MGAVSLLPVIWFLTSHYLWLTSHFSSLVVTASVCFWFHLRAVRRQWKALRSTRIFVCQVTQAQWVALLKDLRTGLFLKSDQIFFHLFWFTFLGFSKRSEREKVLVPINSWCASQLIEPPLSETAQTWRTFPTADIPKWPSAGQECQSWPTHFSLSFPRHLFEVTGNGDLAARWRGRGFFLNIHILVGIVWVVEIVLIIWESSKKKKKKQHCRRGNNAPIQHVTKKQNKSAKHCEWESSEVVDCSGAIYVVFMDSVYFFLP